MNEDRIIDKIKKLLALTSSPNEAEAKSAMNKAQQLMADYCIQEHKLYQNANFGPQIVMTELYNPPFNPSRGLQKALPWITSALAPMFGCHILVQGTKPVIYGFKTNIGVLKYGLDSILNQAKIDYQNGYRIQRTITFDETFWSAFSITLNNRFRENRNQTSGLVVYDHVYAKAAEAKSSKTFDSQSGTSSHSGTSAGQEAGQNVNLVSGIQSGNQGKLLK